MTKPHTVSYEQTVKQMEAEFELLGYNSVTYNGWREFAIQERIKREYLEFTNYESSVLIQELDKRVTLLTETLAEKAGMDIQPIVVEKICDK